MIGHWTAAALLALQGGVVPAGTVPTPTPAPVASVQPMIKMAGDPGPTVQDTRPGPAPMVPATVSPVPSASPTPGASPPAAADSTWAAGQAELVVRVCVDTNGDNRCTVGEGVGGVPVVVVDATTGQPLTDGTTATDGRVHLVVTLEQRTSLTVDVPYLAFSQTAYRAQGGVSLVLPAPVLPKELP